MKYVSGDYTIECYDTHVNDGVYLLVTCPLTTASVKMSVAFDTQSYTETRTPNYGKCEFDLSEYIREANECDWHRIVCQEPTDGNAPKALEAEGQIVSTLQSLKSLTFTFGETEVEVPLAQMPIYTGFSTDKPEVVEHLFNPNYPHTLEVYTDQKRIALALSIDHDAPAFYEYGTNNTSGANEAYQFSLNKYWDDRETQNGQDLKVSISENGQGGLYHIDTRTSGCYLRFLDSDGLIQQLLFDIEGKSKSYTDGDAVRVYGGTRHYYEDHTSLQTNGGSGITSSREQSRVLHCSVSNLPKGLIHDLNALMLSPFVYMYEGGDKWQKVRVVCDELAEETKKAQITAKIDVYTINDASK